MYRVFINGSAGTTGLRLRERLLNREDVELVEIAEADRKEPKAVRDCMAQSDLTFLCLPDAAAREAVSLAEGLSCRILDTSTAHRTNSDWDYGFPELSTAQREKISVSKRVAVPGCHATGFISLVAPLAESGLLPRDYPFTCLSLTGYSGAGKSGIAQYQDESRDPLLGTPRQYGLTQEHKHLPEMAGICGLDFKPVFMPVIGDFYAGMLVTVPVHTRLLKQRRSAEDFRAALETHYAGSRLVTVGSVEPDEMLAAGAMSGRDSLRLFVTGNGERVLLHAMFDNLGKGASGAALQCFNIMTGADECAGLNL